MAEISSMPRTQVAIVRDETTIKAYEAAGLTPPLSALLDSQSFDRHRAAVGLELEIYSKKVDRFGWDRDKGSPVQDRIISDWMEALSDFPLDEIRESIARLMRRNKPVHEGSVHSEIMRIRQAKADRFRMGIRL